MVTFDLEKDFDYEKLDLLSIEDKKLHATLISLKKNSNKKNVVLYIHGYIDYFFHPHVAEEFYKHDFDFYAIDLRRYGRSLLPHQKPNYCERIEEYFEDIDLALKKIFSTDKKVYLLGHSTGGLIASSYMNRGLKRESISGLILNSPFLEMAQPKWMTNLFYFILKPLSKIFPHGKSNKGLSPIYAESLHKDHTGIWEFNLNWKPIKGYPVYFKWFVAIVEAQKALQDSDIKVPVLLLHSSQSHVPKKHVKKIYVSDTVLNIEHMKKLGPKLGEKVTLISIENGMHDLFLSSEKVRQKAFYEMFKWL